MKSRRLLALIAIFISAFIAVTAIRSWFSGTSLFSLLPGFSERKQQFAPEKFTLSQDAPLALGDVELLSRLNNEYAKLTAAVVPSVVSINTAGVRRERVSDIWGRTGFRDNPTQGQGSGAIVTHEGHIVTNHHVIAGQTEFQITLHSGKQYQARLIGDDPLLDIAVLKIDSSETFPPLKMGDSTEARVGQIVLAVGNPFGLGETVTQGIISAKERSLSDTQRDLFQTDAAINPGNSGGPLINLRGEIIGINVAIFSPDKQNPGFQGVGFSIPANDVKETLLQILQRGRPIRGFLGVRMISDLDLTTRAELGYPDREGAAIGSITPNSPAQAAGLQPADVVQALDGEKIKDTNQFLTLLQRTKVGQTISLTIWRKGQILTLTPTIIESDAPSSTTAATADSPENPQAILEAIGIQARDLSVPERMNGYRGVVVTAISENGTAATRVIPGDLILAVNDARISSTREFFIYLAASASTQATTLHILRANQLIRITLPK